MLFRAFLLAHRREQGVNFPAQVSPAFARGGVCAAAPGVGCSELLQLRVWVRLGGSSLQGGSGSLWDTVIAVGEARLAAGGEHHSGG